MSVAVLHRHLQCRVALASRRQHDERHHVGEYRATQPIRLPGLCVAVTTPGAALSVVTVGAILPASPLGPTLGFAPLPVGFFIALVGMVICYMALVEVGKRFFYGAAAARAPHEPRAYNPNRQLRRRAARFRSSVGVPPGPLLTGIPRNPPGPSDTAHSSTTTGA